MFKYAMKAAAKAESQLRDRIISFGKLGIKPIIELHLFGSEDVFGSEREDVVKICRNFKECEYMVHFPIMDTKTGYLYDGFDDERKKLESVLDFTSEIGAGVLIMHCCYGFNKKISKKEAFTKFLEKVCRWNDLAKRRSLKILLENYGFAWLPPGLGADYIVSPIDHFFPWDMEWMHETIQREKLSFVAILLDVAHAVLSSNMFNIRQRYGHLSQDGRFKNIYSEDLDRKDFLSAADFIFDFIDYFHISDTFVWKPENGRDDMRKYLYTENLPIGEGNVDFLEILKKTKGNKTLVMEINPDNGDHTHNVSQYQAIAWFQNNFNREDQNVHNNF